MKTKLFLTGLALAALIAFSSAQAPANDGRGAANGVCSEECVNFVDNNNDGVCDNHQDNQVSAGNGYRLRLAWFRGNGNRQGNGQGYRYGSGFRPGAGKHLYGQGNCVVAE